MKKRFIIFLIILINITIGHTRVAGYYYVQQEGNRDGYSLPYLEAFSTTTLPAEWLSDMSLSADHGTSGSIGLNKRLYSGSATCYAISPLVGSITSSTYLSFHYRIVNVTGYPLVGKNLSAGDMIEIQVSTDDGSSFTTFHTIDMNNHTASSEFTNKMLSLAEYNDQFVKIRFLCSWASGDYYADFDNILFEDGNNMSYSTSTTEQPNLGNIGIGTNNNEIIRLQVVTQKSANPLYLTSINVNVSGEVNISAAKVFYTTTPIFSTSSQFGGTINNPSGAFTFTGSQMLSQGNNYFWMAYDIKTSATAGNTVDGACQSFMTSESSNSKIPSVQSPAPVGRKIGQLFTGTKIILVTPPGDFTSVAAAITALNNGVVGPGGVIFDVAAGHTETTTSVIWLTTTGTAFNPVTFRKSGTGNNPLITRTDVGVVSTSAIGNNGDAVIMMDGTDYITFDGIDVASQNSGIEYGYYLRKASAMDACKNVTIKNSSITMTKGNRLVAGICASNNIPGINGVTVLSPGGSHESITLTGNTISSIFCGIYLKGSDDFNDQNFIVGSNGNGNTIQNFGGAAFETWGIYIYGIQDVQVSHNIINNMAEGGSAFTESASGIYNGSISNISFTAEYNSIILTSVSSQLYGLYNSTTGPVQLNNNSLSLSNTSSSAAVYAFIHNNQSFAASSSSNTSISNNIFAACTFQTTGPTYLIFNDNARQSPEITSIQGNSTSGNISRTGASGSMFLYYNNSPATGIENISGNSFTNISLTGSSSFGGIFSQTNAGHTQNVYNNTISGISGGTGDVNLIDLGLAGNRSVYENDIFSITAGGKITGIVSGTGGNPVKIYKNEIHDLNSSSSSTIADIVSGIQINSGSAVYLYNNFISDLKAPSGNSDDVIRGISVNSTLENSIIGIYYNTIYLDAGSGGENFGTSGLYHASSIMATTAALDLRNNIIINKSIRNGSSSTIAFRRSDAELANYKPTSNNNIFYAGIPGEHNLIYSPSACQTMDEYRVTVGPNRDSLSFSEDPVFINIAVTPYDLHLQDDIVSYCESGARPVTSPVMISDDFDGAERPTIPDIGADEFNGIAAFVEVPISFTATWVDSYQNELEFESNPASNDIVIVYNLSGTFTNPSGVPAEGQALANGEVLYIGTGSPLFHSNLSPGVTVYYKAFCYNGLNYSFGITANATPPPEPISTWTGNFSSDWAEPLNWTNGVPGNNYEITILPGTFNPVILTPVTVFSIAIMEGAEIEIIQPGSLTITGN